MTLCERQPSSFIASSSSNVQREFVNILQEKLKNFPLRAEKEKSDNSSSIRKEQPRVKGEKKNVNTKRAGSAHKKSSQLCGISK